MPRPGLDAHYPLLALLVVASATASAQDATGPSPAEQLIAREQTRNQVNEAFETFHAGGGGQERQDRLVVAAERLAEIGAPAVPILADELAQSRPQSFILCAAALGTIGGSAAEAALREALRHADEDPPDDPWALTRKAYAGSALVRAGHLDALELLASGRQLAASYELYFGLSVLSLGALVHAPDSVPYVHRVLERHAPPTGDVAVRVAAAHALGRIGHASSLDRLIALVQDPDSNVRRAALDGLAIYDAPEATAALLRALEEEQSSPVRYMAAWSLEQRLPAAARPALVARLAAEDSAPVRAVIYRTLARLGGADALRALSEHLGRRDAEDRAGLIEALRLVRDPATLVVFRAAIRDPDSGVVAQAVAGLRELGTPAAVEILLQLVDAPNWAAAGAAVRRLTELDEARAVPRIVERLVRVELAQVVVEPLARERVYALADALLVLGRPQRLAELREAAARQRDGELVRYLHGLLARLDQLATNGNDVARWIEALESADLALRKLAYAQLGRLGGTTAAEALAQRFGRADLPEGVEILRALGAIDAPASRALIERVLGTPEFDPAAREALRSMAAWGARRLGGEAMFAALRASAERRSGRDAVVLAYLAVLGRERALPTLDALRIPRLLYPRWERGQELDALDKIARDVRAGRALDPFDVPPERLDFTRQGWTVKR